MSQQWHYTGAGKQLGPVSGTELKRMASSGELAPNDLLWKEGMPNWVRAQKLTGLFTVTASPVPPPLPHSTPAATAAPDASPECRLPSEEQVKQTQTGSRGIGDRLFDLRPSKMGGIAFTVFGAALGGWAFTRLHSLEGQFHG